MLNSTVRSGSEAEAFALRGSAVAVVEAAEKSIALFGRKAAVISRIAEVSDQCGKPGWDGDDAEAVSEISVAQALDFIRALPDGLPLPEVAPEPDGAISLDWIESRHRLFSLSVGASPRLSYAWLDGSDRGHGVARFDGESVPTRVIEGIVGVCDARIRVD